MKHSVGRLFLRWNLHNRVCVCVAYFENGKMAFMKIDKNKIMLLCNNFIAASYDCALEYPVLIKKRKINENRWNEMVFEQTGLLEIQRTNPIAADFTRKQFNQFCNVYLK